ncbi:Alpha-galactosidase [Aestuariimicrobium sp. T2.26MG-19.2B]|nr:Alpha-galactosidase [Aestuariimicrobium sp. T2.26MG-19.2B]
MEISIHLPQPDMGRGRSARHSCAVNNAAQPSTEPSTSGNPTRVAHLRRDGVSVVVELGRGLPRILHWGADLGELTESDLAAVELQTRATTGDSRVHAPYPVTVLPALAEGWVERPSLSGHRTDHTAWAPLFTAAGHELTDHQVVARADDEASGLALAVHLALEVGGVLTLTCTLTNTGDTDFELTSLEPHLPVPSRATELVDFTGRWAQERTRQRREFLVGHWVRESRGGKPGFESPWVTMATTHEAGHRSGEVWGIHLGWSGSQVTAATRTPYDTRALSAGEMLLPGEVVLAPGRSHTSPTLFAAWGRGMDAMAERFHTLVRSWPNQRAARRPVTWNSWEAVYFDVDPDTLMAAARRAAEIGVERVVVDDGWFTGRRDDTSSLGDWVVDTQRWPQGMKPLADLVHSLGMEFGLWVEPEMVNLDSDLARSHPEWLFDAGHGAGLPSRHQHVLDLTHPEAWRHVRDQISTVIGEVGIDALKWDHNRYLLDAGHQPSGAPAVRAQTVAALALMRDLIERHPGLQIESCSSGGGRADLGVMQIATRMWPSDINDPHERTSILAATELLLPPEVTGTHLGASPDHITGRSFSLATRGLLALGGHLGIEAPLERLPQAQLDELAAWVALHRRHRDLLHSGRVVHVDTDPAIAVRGVVAEDSSEALFSLVVLNRPVTWPAERWRLEGLDPHRRYRVSELSATGAARSEPAWLAESITASGAALIEIGLECPRLNPDTGVLVHVEEVR